MMQSSGETQPREREGVPTPLFWPAKPRVPQPRAPDLTVWMCLT
jgi:hypothetical protein